MLFFRLALLNKNISASRFEYLKRKALFCCIQNSSTK